MKIKSEVAKELAAEIREFLEQHGKRMTENPSDWTSPDACCLEAAAGHLESLGRLITVPFSEWSSGGFGPYFDKNARLWHDSLIEKCKEFVKK